MLLSQRLSELHARVARRDLELPDLRTVGRLKRTVGMTMEAVGCHVGIGGRCLVESAHRSVLTEVVGFAEDRLLLMALDDPTGLEPDARVLPVGDTHHTPDAAAWIGRVVDGLGRPLDSGESLLWRDECAPQKLAALDRAAITEPLDVGVRAINGLMSVGRGQRMGLFAGSGVGKSVLLGMMSRNTTADVNVVALVGERGREVNEFLQENLGKEGLARSVVVVAPADDPPLMRMKAAELAMTVAEVLRDQGRQVLLLMDSLTRYAMAQREIALAIGEPPATKGYTPSVFARLPRLVERAGNGRVGQGSITGFFTVLVEGDDNQDPIADAARAILDGHVVLSRALAEEGHFPAIDVEASISRLMHKLVPAVHLQGAQTLRRLLARYRRNEDLISVGAYAEGADPETDKAIRLMSKMKAYLQQGMNERSSFDNATAQLAQFTGK